MASIENRSRYVVTVQNRDDLTKTFACTREAELKTYIAHLKAQGYKAKLSRTNDNYLVRVREAGKTKQTLPASSEQEAIDIAEVRGRADLYKLSQSFGNSEILPGTASRALLFLIYRNFS